MTNKHQTTDDCLTWRRIILDKTKFKRTVHGAWCRANHASNKIIYKEGPEDVVKIMILRMGQLREDT